MPEKDLEKTKVTNFEEENGADEDNGEEVKRNSRGELVLPKILTYDEIDRFLLAIDDLEDLVAKRT